MPSIYTGPHDSRIRTAYIQAVAHVGLGRLQGFMVRLRVNTSAVGNRLDDDGDTDTLGSHVRTYVRAGISSGLPCIRIRGCDHFRQWMVSYIEARLTDAGIEVAQRRDMILCPQHGSLAANHYCRAEHLHRMLITEGYKAYRVLDGVVTTMTVPKAVVDRMIERVEAWNAR